ncbi:MAG: dipeptide ABC transporter ATP binding subunit DppF, partial [Thiothrix sp.]|nr:dipeptide ABC transporter ATP binding subunit DppF [Thiothrix sp.]
PVEYADSEAIFTRPLHPYTEALFSATPVAEVGQKRERIHLQGEPPSPLNPPPGCPFQPRCAFAGARCTQSVPELHQAGAVQVACILR